MSVDVHSAINRIFQEFRTDMLGAFDQAPRIWPSFAMEIPSSSRSTLHAWLGNQATVKEWLGARKSNSLGTRTWEVLNREFELTFEFEANQIADDMSGLVASALMQARSSGVKFARHEDLLLAATLEAGLTSACWDGQNFFDGSHPVDVDGLTSGTYSNSLTSSPLTHANFNAALVAQRKFKLEDGSPMVPPGANLTLIVPPALELAASQILLVKNLTSAAAIGLFGTSGASENPLIGKASIVVNPYLTSDTRWYLGASDGIVKPLMLQRRSPLETSEIGPGSQLYFDKKKIQVGSNARYAASYTLPQLMITGNA